MSLTQRFFKAIMPKKWFEAAEADSRRWVFTCPCGNEQSIWDSGGIRWKAAGKSKTGIRCLACGKFGLQTLEKQ